MNQTSIYIGTSLGTTLAVVCSWQRNQSILWAIFHGLLSWIYVIYFALTRKELERKKQPNQGVRGAPFQQNAANLEEFLEEDPIARHLDTTEQMRRFAEWKNQKTQK
jgi:hypothetical protein